MIESVWDVDESILNRKALGKPFGIKLTSSFFTSVFSNRVADNAGFHLDLECTFGELMKMRPDFKYESIKDEKFSMKTLLLD